MKTLVVAALCTFAVAACADSQQPPPRDPSITTTSANQPAYESNANTASSPVTESNRPVMALPNTQTPAQPQSQYQPPQPQPQQQPVVTDNPGKGDQTPSADNTKNNDRDRQGGTLTPGNQGNSRTETQITADVRKGLMASSALSFTAKNAKIITTGSKVTLRGAVKSDAEKSEIEKVAKATAGVTDVDNQLEVKK